MSFFSSVGNKVASAVTSEAQTLPNRFLQRGGFLPMGARQIPQRTDSVEELAASLRAHAKNGQSLAAKIEDSFVKNVSKELSIDLRSEAERKHKDIYTIASEIYNGEDLKLRRWHMINNQGVSPMDAEANIKYLSKDFALRIQNVKDSIEAAKLNSSALNDFVANMKDLPESALKVAHDLVDLANVKALLNNEIFPSVNLNSVGQEAATGQKATILSYLLKSIPNIAEKNPKMLDLAETVTSNVDEGAAKFFLFKLLGGQPLPKSEEGFKVAEAFVPTLAKRLLSGMPSMDLGKDCKENYFYNAIVNLCNPQDIEGKECNTAISKFLDFIKANPHLKFSTDSLVDAEKLEITDRAFENMESLPEIYKNLKNKDIDVDAFIKHNVNID